MNARAYYNEVDPFAAAWLRNLVAAGLVAPGDVDERDISDVLPSDLAGYAQCHFFAGIGGWSHALRLAGWPDDRPVWTGSCPCQPFSQAGSRKGLSDERHLWPAFFHLVEVARPAVVLGEQVASRDGLAWLDLVSADLEGAGYAFGAADLCAAGVGAPHLRQRLWWVGYADGARRESWPVAEDVSTGGIEPAGGPDIALDDASSDGRHAGGDDNPRHVGVVLDATGLARGSLGDTGRPRLPPCERPDLRGEGRGQEGRAAQQSGGAPGGLADGDGQRQPRRAQPDGGALGSEQPAPRRPDPLRCGADHWSELEWLPCRDGKARPTQPGLQPLAHGVSNRVGTLRGAGNAIVPQVAAAFIEAVMGERP